MEFIKNVRISTARFQAQGFVRVCVLEVRPVSPSQLNQLQQPISWNCISLRLATQA
jgi:hypothetical protein